MKLTPANQKIIDTAFHALDAHQSDTFQATFQLGLAMIAAKRVLKAKFVKTMEARRPQCYRSIGYAMAIVKAFGDQPADKIKDVPLNILRRLSSKSLTRVREEILAQEEPLAADKIAERIREATRQPIQKALSAAIGNDPEVVLSALATARTKVELALAVGFEGGWSGEMLAEAEALRLLVRELPRQIRKRLPISKPSPAPAPQSPRATTKKIRKLEPQQ